jgi:glycosyltransferase involved in cell wall biosynthesis
LTDPLRVLHLRNSDLLGGPERLLLDQAKRASPGLETTLASFARPGEPHPFLEAAEAEGLRTRRIPQRGSYDPRVFARTRALLASLRPDVVVGHDYKANLALRRAARGLAIPRAAVVHGYTAENLKVRVFEALDRRTLRSADAVVAVSEASRDALVASGVPAGRIRVVENAVDAARVRAEAAGGREAVRAEWGVGARDLVVLALGRLSPEKGHRVLLDAFLALPPGSARLVLVGDGAERGALEARAPKDGRVRFAGWRTDAARCLGAADVFALPSLREGLPLAMLEAMAAGLPVVASRVGGVPGALAEGACGLLVPPGDAGALAEALARLLGDPALCRRLGEAGAARVRERHGAEGQAAALEAVYRSISRRR